MVRIETWKDVVGYEGRYQVSDMGRVISKPKIRRPYDKLLKPQYFKTGYAYLDLGDGKRINRYLLHRVVCEAFHPNPEGKPQVNHKNGDKSDNRSENLEWATNSENQKHSIRTGLRSAKGEKNSQSKLTASQVEGIRILHKKGWSGKTLTQKFKVSPSTISGIVNKRTWH